MKVYNVCMTITGHRYIEKYVCTLQRLEQQIKTCICNSSKSGAGMTLKSKPISSDYICTNKTQLLLSIFLCNTTVVTINNCKTKHYM